MGGDSISAEKFIDVLQDIHRKLDEGFKGAYAQMRSIEDAAQKRQANCGERFTVLEKSIATREAANGVKQQYENDTRDTWKYIIRGAALAGVLAGGGMFYKLFILTSELSRLGILK